MLAALVARAEISLRMSIRRAVFGTVGGVLMLVGVGFLTLSLWIFLAASLGAGVAALIIGFAYLGGGLIFLAIGRRRGIYLPPPAPGAGPVTGSPKLGMAEAFLFGLDAGQSVRRRRR